MNFDERNEQAIQLKAHTNHGEDNTTQSEIIEVQVFPRLPGVGEGMNLKEVSAR